MAKSCKIPKLSGTLSNSQWYAGQAEAARICERRGVRMHLVYSPAKTKKIVSVRDEIILVLRGWGWSTTQVGAIINKTHSMVVYALQRMETAASIETYIGLARPNGVHLEHDNETERQGDSGRSVDAGGVRDGGGDLGSSGKQQRPLDDSEGCREGTTQMYRSTGPRWTTTSPP